MSIEAMKQVIELYDKYCYNNDYGGIEFSNKHGYKFIEAIEALRTALSQQPAAQPVDERETFEAWARPNGYDLRRNDVLGHYSSIDTSRAWAGFRAGRASLHTYQPATPEPVDFPAGAIVNGRTLMERIEAYPFESQGGDLRMCSDWHELRSCFEHLADYVSTHPVPSVPDDVVRDAERYRWLRDPKNHAQIGVGQWTDDGFGWRYSDEADAAIDTAMRCFVSSKLGNEVDVPEELLK